MIPKSFKKVIAKAKLVLKLKFINPLLKIKKSKVKKTIKQKRKNNLKEIVKK
jgi:hypothetical protein